MAQHWSQQARLGLECESGPFSFLRQNTPVPSSPWQIKSLRPLLSCLGFFPCLLTEMEESISARLLKGHQCCPETSTHECHLAAPACQVPHWERRREPLVFDLGPPLTHKSCHLPAARSLKLVLSSLSTRPVPQTTRLLLLTPTSHTSP